MEPMTCPNCGTRVAPKADGTCPACLRSMTEGSASQTAFDANDPQAALAASRRAAEASFLRECGSEAMHRRPTGLTALALIQFFFAASVGCGYLMISFPSPEFRGIFRLARDVNPVYMILSPLITELLLVSSAGGYLSQNRVYGYWGGNVLAVWSIANLVIYGVLHEFPGIWWIGIKLIYPTVLLCLLNRYYRNAFR